MVPRARPARVLQRGRHRRHGPGKERLAGRRSGGSGGRFVLERQRGGREVGGSSDGAAADGQ